ncbi:MULTISPECIES: hypothetical protein [Streptomyces]|uniref:hypothetical protein n=1 Tax=Streptomyces TaxID=1883 RepID=UPI0023DD3188|nr:hypothetical protein [Streptomyces sp. FXJ1.172]WEP00779.1 hypothetical protein A6P39_042155 [Streptomyces sp. FXJ1.172]
MSPSTARTPMDIDNERDRRSRFRPPDARPPARGPWLQKTRLANNAFALEKVSRQRRIIAYARIGADGQADKELAAVRRLIEEQGHTRLREVTDVGAPHAPLSRTGWNEARRLVRAGLADGIAALNRDAVSIHNQEYEDELLWLGERPALLLLVIGEAT